MSFLIVLLAVILYQGVPQARRVQVDDWLPGWYAAAKKMAGGNHRAAMLFYLLLPLAVLSGLLYLLEGYGQGLLVFAAQLLVVLYSFGRGDLEAQVRLLQSDLAREDLQAAFHDAAELNISHRLGEAETWSDFYQELLAALPYRYFERSFAVVFWFMLLGAPGALLYRLLALHGDLPLEGENPQREKLLWVLEWLPARLLALTLGLVGNFSYAVGHLQEMIFCPRTATAALLRKVLGGALAVDHSDNSPAAVGLSQLPLMEGIIRRAMVTWLVVLALLVILS